MYKSTAVFQGGGSLGAYTCGVLKSKNKNYDLCIGTSTGALLAPFAVLGMYDELIDMYTNVTSEKIFNVNPFDKKGHLKPINAIYRLTIGKNTLGENLNLRKLIKEKFTIDLYLKIRSLNKNVVVVVCNISDKESTTEYKSINDYSYNTFCDFIWASCSVPVVTSIPVINGKQYVDGGVTENVALSKAQKMTEGEIDCYFHNVKSETGLRTSIKNMLHLASRTFNIIREETRKDDLESGIQQGIIENDRNIVSYSYLPSELTSNALIFDKKLMLEWVNLGLNK